MISRFKFYVAVCTILTFTLFFSVSSQAQSTENVFSSPLPLEQISNFARVFETIKTHYVEHVSDEKLLNDAIRGMISGLDPHSVYLDSSSTNALRIDTIGKYGGLGVEVNNEGGYLRVISPIDDTPAHKAGVLPGDLIVQLNNRPVDSMSLDEAVNLMRGEPGTDITLTIIRAGVDQPLTITLTRAVIKIRSVRGRLLEPNFGYLRITQFQSITPELAREKILNLFEESGSVQGMILDLRNNPGGELQSAIGISDMFLDRGVIVTTRNRDGMSVHEFKASPGDILRDIPLVVLVNEGSASASEIVAGALQDHKRAIIMGKKTFGKGSVQSVLTVDTDTSVKLTTHRYYTPADRSIQGRGIIPDIVIDRREFADTSQTPQEVENFIRESDLKGALENESEDGSDPNVDDSSSPSINPSVGNDYQLQEALNLLKGLQIIREITG